jgi:hypothetical protein
MGAEKTQEKTGSTTVVNQTTTPTPTAEETQLNQMNLRMALANEQGSTAMQKNAYALGNQLLTSFSSPGGQQWQSLIGGIDQNQQNSIVNQGLQAGRSQLNQSGIMDSGTAASVMGRSASDLYGNMAQFNVGTLQNALNLALSGQAQVQAPALSTSSQLSSSLAGLRSVNSSGTNTMSGNKTTLGMNPFLKSLQSSGGQFLGSGGNWSWGMNI